MKIKGEIWLFAMIGGLYAFIILMNVGKDAGPAAWVGFLGSLIGSVITIIGAYVVFHMQSEATDQRHLETVRSLLQELKDAGGSMAAAGAENNPAKHVREASVAYATALSVGAAISANGPRIARVAERLRVAPEAVELRRLEAAQAGVAAADLHARGGEIETFADELIETLRKGL